MKSTNPTEDIFSIMAYNHIMSQGSIKANALFMVHEVKVTENAVVIEILSPFYIYDIRMALTNSGKVNVVQIC